MAAMHSLVGKRFGKLVVLERIPHKAGQIQVHYICQCDCGNVIETDAACLRGGKTSCGCILANRKLKKLEQKKELLETKERLRRIKIAEKCRFPNNLCKLSKQGQCCHTCKEKNFCLEVCLNTPEKCGLIENIKRAEAS